MLPSVGLSPVLWLGQLSALVNPSLGCGSALVLLGEHRGTSRACSVMVGCVRVFYLERRFKKFPRILLFEELLRFTVLICLVLTEPGSTFQTP